MNIVNLCCYVDAYYSEAEYEENIAISQDLYNKIKDKIKQIKIHIPDLDGKYSEVKAEIETQPCDEEYIADFWNDPSKDGDYMYYELEEICYELNLDLDKDIKEVYNYIESLDYKVDLKANVRKSNVDKILNFINELNNK